MTGTDAPRRSLRWPLVVLAVGASALVLGVAVGATVIASNGGESATGSVEQATLLNWLLIQSVRNDTVPTPLPMGLSTNVSGPTHLPSANTSFRLGAATVGHNAVRWDIELTGGPLSTEVELSFDAANVTSGAVTAITVFVLTPSSGPPFPPVYTIFLDAGTAMVILGGETLVEQECLGVGVCP